MSDDFLRRTLRQSGDSLICPVILLFKKGKLLIGRRHYTPDKWKKTTVWTIPGGRSGPGESIETTLQREINEETGITDVVIDSFLGEFPGAKKGDRVFLFEGLTSHEPKLMEPEKFSEWRWVKVSELPDNFINPEVVKYLKSAYAQRQK